MQTTIQNPISCYGIGLHSGRKTQVTLKPAKPNTGVVFVRTDVSELDNIIQASYKMVYDVTLSTCIQNSANVSIGTIEHIMAAIWGSGISNLIIEVDGPEVPIMDGSSKPFVFMLECAGTRQQNAPKKQLKILKEIVLIDKNSEVIVKPSSETIVNVTIDFTSPAIGKQSHAYSSNSSFRDEIADSRTFGFMHEHKYLQERGMNLGASLENAIGIDNDVILNPEGLRHENEFARHKLLDLLGDLFTAGGNFIGHLDGYKTSHSLNNKLLHKIFENPYAYQWI